jgi:hypothetical protein
MGALQDWNVILSIAAIVITLGSVAAKIYGSFRLRRFGFKIEFMELKKRLEEQTTDPLLPARERLWDAKTALLRQEAVAKTNRLTSALLIVGQYIIGGLLASSFIQESLSRQLVGVLGLLVLFSSLVYQHFRPDLQLRGALQRAVKLKTLIRDVEDWFSGIEKGIPTAPSVHEVRTKISKALNEIESAETQDVDAYSKSQLSERQKA